MPRGGLGHEEQLWSDFKGLGEAHLLLIAAGKFLHELLFAGALIPVRGCIAGAFGNGLFVANLSGPKFLRSVSASGAR